MEAKKIKNEISKYCFYWPKNQNSFDSIANPPYRSLMEREKLRMESEKTDFIDKKSNIPWLNIKPTIQKAYGREKTKNGIIKHWFNWQKNQISSISNPPYRRPMEGKQQRMEWEGVAWK